MDAVARVWPASVTVIHGYVYCGIELNFLRLF
jgi:hypothetical protein